MAAEEISDFLENGNIKNSVNFPNCDMGALGAGSRITIMHKNVPNMINAITDAIAKKGMNIEHMLNKSKGDYAYTILDIATKIDPAFGGELEKAENVIKVTIL